MKPATNRFFGWLKTSWGADLLDEAVAHDDDAVTERHGLRLVVGDVDECGVDAGAELDDLSAHLVTELGVEVGQRLVHQQDLRIADDGAADGDALALAAGQGLRLAVEVFRDAENFGGLADLLVDLLLRDLLQLQGECHVLVHGHVRVQSIVLEDHGDVAVLRGHVVHQTVADVQFAVRDLFQTGDHAERRGLAAAGRADENDELTVRDVQAEFLNGDDAFVRDLKIGLRLVRGVLLLLLFLLRVGVGVDLFDVFQRNICHATGSDPGASACPDLTSAREARMHYGRSPHCRTASLRWVIPPYPAVRR